MGTTAKISNISRTESQHLNVSRLVLQLSLPNPLKPGVNENLGHFFKFEALWLPNQVEHQDKLDGNGK